MSKPNLAASSLANLLAVGVGGAVGTLLRAAVVAAVPMSGAMPWGTLTVNLTGAFLLGFVVAAVPPSTRWASYRLVLGTGLLGAYTTFATLAVELHTLAVDAAEDVAGAYLVVSTIGGIGTAVLGLQLGHRMASRRRSDP